MQKVVFGLLYFILSISSLHSENLTEKYKHMMGSRDYNPEASFSGEIEPSSNNATVKKLSKAIASIQNIKKSTFESSKDFQTKRAEKIAVLEKDEKFFIENGSKDYSAGTLKMKKYNPDTEVATLSLSWDSALTKLLEGTKKPSIITLSINREEAKALFKNKDTHFFHIKVQYINNKLTLTQILLYNKYKLYTKQKQTEYTNTSTTAQATSLQCTNYTVTARQLNIRAKPTVKSNTLGQITQGESICIYRFSDGWGESKYGWISKKYLVTKTSYDNDQNSNSLVSVPLTNNESNTASNEETSSSMPLGVKIILAIIILSLLFTYWKYALGFIILMVLFQIFFR